MEPTVVSSHNFTAEVLEKSYEKPVLVDFFAQWCGPCQMLKPILERLTQEYDFALAKVDIDQEPDLANTYGVQGVPDVRIVDQGTIRDGFVGVLPEPNIRELLAQLGLKSALEMGLEAAEAATTKGDLEQAKRLYSELIEQYPENRQLILAAAKFLIRQNRLESAQKLLATIQESERDYFTQAQATKALIEFQQICQEPVMENALDELYVQACRSTLAGSYESALQDFLKIVSQDRKYRNDGGRKAMITIFDLLGNQHPLTRDFRKQLSRILY